MSVETAKAFLRKVQEDAVLQARVGSALSGSALSADPAAMLAIAASEGLHFSASAYATAVREHTEDRAHEGQLLSDDVLAEVAGGFAVPTFASSKKSALGFAVPTYASTQSSGFAVPTFAGTGSGGGSSGGSSGGGSSGGSSGGSTGSSGGGSCSGGSGGSSGGSSGSGGGSGSGSGSGSGGGSGSSGSSCS